MRRAEAGLLLWVLRPALGWDARTRDVGRARTRAGAPEHQKLGRGQGPTRLSGRWIGPTGPDPGPTGRIRKTEAGGLDRERPIHDHLPQRLPDHLTRRLDRLERENRRLKVVGGLALLGMAALTVMGQTPPTSVANTLEAERFVLRDNAGNVRATLGLRPDGTAALALADDTQQDRAVPERHRARPGGRRSLRSRRAPARRPGRARGRLRAAHPARPGRSAARRAPDAWRRPPEPRPARPGRPAPVAARAHRRGGHRAHPLRP